MIHIYNHNLIKQTSIPYTHEELEEHGIEKLYPPFQKDWHYSFEDIKYPKLVNGELIEKTYTELKLDGIIPLLEGEVTIDNEIVVKPKPDGYKVQWNGQEWIETATLIEKEEILRNNIISKTSELLKYQSAGFGNVELEKELETLKKIHLEITHQIAIE